MHTLLFFLIAITLSVPPAAKLLAVVVAVYGILQGLKKIPIFTKYLTGVWAIVFNIIFSICGVLVTIPADQLYTIGTLNSILNIVMTALGAAGIHGTIRSFLTPTVQATFPPDTQVKEVPAFLEPKDPAAVPVDKDK